MSSLCW